MHKLGVIDGLTGALSSCHGHRFWGLSSSSHILIVHLFGTVLLRATTEVLAKQKCFLHSYDSSMEETVDSVVL